MKCRLPCQFELGLSSFQECDIGERKAGTGRTFIKHILDNLSKHLFSALNADSRILFIK